MNWLDSNDLSKLSLSSIIMALTAYEKDNDKKRVFGIQDISWNRIFYIVIQQPTV